MHTFNKQLGSERSGFPWNRVVSVSVIALAFLLLGSATVAKATEIVPAVGLSKGVDTDETKTSANLALRSGIFGPVVQGEIGVGYRQESRFNDQLKIHQIPVTASVLLYPVRQIHADVGAGWYNTKYEYDTTPDIEDETTQDFGVHVGAGLELPVANRVALDMTGRYVFMQDLESKLVPESFDPDFWTMSLGLAFGF